MSCWGCSERCDNDVENFDIDELLDEINGRLPREHGYGRLELISVLDLNAIKRAILSDDKNEAIWLIDASIFPKYKDVQAAKAAWKKAIAPPPAPPKIGLWMHAI